MIVETPDPVRQLEFLEKAYSVWKWAVFPLLKFTPNYDRTKFKCECRKGWACGRAGSHPMIRWGQRDEYPDLDGIRDLVRRGYHGWGVHLGWSGMKCLDLDPRNGADALGFVTNWKYEEGIPFLAVHTGGGGIHFYFPAEDTIHPTRGFHLGGDDWFCALDDDNGTDLFAGQHYMRLPYTPHKSGSIFLPFNPPNEIHYERIINAN